MRHGRVRRAYIGIAAGPRPLPPQARTRLGRGSGVEIVEVAVDSPAARAGLRVEDLVIELDGRAIASVDDVQRSMTEAAIGKTIPLTVLRGGHQLELVIAPVELIAR
jgi:S1-C subfamily serine protease